MTQFQIKHRAKGTEDPLPEGSFALDTSHFSKAERRILEAISDASQAYAIAWHELPSPDFLMNIGYAAIAGMYPRWTAKRAFMTTHKLIKFIADSVELANDQARGNG